MARSEAKTRRELIDPRLKDAGWFEYDWQIEDEYAITAGRIHFDGKSGKRAKPQYADYLLRYSPSKAVAIVEAKKEELSHLEGSKQAKDYAKKLGMWFAYSTNGVEIEFFDLKNNTQKTVDRFHSPEELWNLYLENAEIKEEKENLVALTHDYYDESGIGQRRKPRYYQEAAVNNAIESIIKGNKRVLITMATGTGKTFAAIQLVYKLYKANKAKKILFIVDRNLLADQAYADFSNAMDKGACYRVDSKADIKTSRSVYFSIYQTLVGIDDEGNKVGRPDKYKEFPANFFDLIVIDEAHRGGTKEDGSWFKLLEYFGSATQVGLTATPKREESNNTYKYFGAPVVNYSLKDGINDGFLSPYIIKRVTSNIDALGYKPEHNDVRDVRGQKLEVKTYLTPDFRRRLMIPQRTKAFAYHLLRHLFLTDPLGKTIVFCENQEHALLMAKYVNEGFNEYKVKYNFKYNGEYATRITGKDKEANGKYPDLEKFQNLDSNEPIVVTTSKLLTTGVDVKTVKNVVLFRNIGSMVEFKQIIGRGTRVYDHPNKFKEKLGFYILEYANYSTQLFEDPEWDDDPENFIFEGTLNVDEEANIDEPGTESVPVASEEEEGENVNSSGIYEEPDEDRQQFIRYKMSEEFLDGRIEMAAETESYCDANGKPCSPETFLIYEGEKFKKQFATPEAFQQIWKDGKERNHFINETAAEIGLNVDALVNIFFNKHKVRDVDLGDILAYLFFGQNYLTKEERIVKAKELHPGIFNSTDSNKATLAEDILSVYMDMESKPLYFGQELWQTPKLSKYGGIKDISDYVGGTDNLQALINDLQTSIYDERIAA
ncbi:EcoAI/FtnUII family type I restriction enzme subunit R [Halobacteriovorax sp. ZH1_bin.1]|uniref:EcoAI/FtnUII family type I restriction enzme subunit R n=1 Tax=Halobacteriovorax sp. ZH1_bin.1 TaxID=3157723 RepID=UPI00371FDB24